MHSEHAADAARHQVRDLLLDDGLAGHAEVAEQHQQGADADEHPPDPRPGRPRPASARGAGDRDRRRGRPAGGGIDGPPVTGPGAGEPGGQGRDGTRHRASALRVRGQVEQGHAVGEARADGTGGLGLGRHPVTGRRGGGASWPNLGGRRGHPVPPRDGVLPRRASRCHPTPVPVQPSVDVGVAGGRRTVAEAVGVAPGPRSGRSGCGRRSRR